MDPTTVRLFPLVRQISARVSPVIVQLPVTANQVTAASLAVGLAACWGLMQGGFSWTLGGATLFTLCYILDNCDGEVARFKNQTSRFGDKFDTFVDWVVHAGFFAALGAGVAKESGNDLWLWLGFIAAAGGTINYFIGVAVDARLRLETGDAPDTNGQKNDDHPPMPENWKQWALMTFREFARADFCFIVLALALIDLTWLLLPAGAIGAHVYWMTQFVRGARDYHV